MHNYSLQSGFPYCSLTSPACSINPPRVYNLFVLFGRTPWSPAMVCPKLCVIFERTFADLCNITVHWRLTIAFRIQALKWNDILTISLSLKRNYTILVPCLGYKSDGSEVKCRPGGTQRNSDEAVQEFKQNNEVNKWELSIMLDGDKEKENSWRTERKDSEFDIGKKCSTRIRRCSLWIIVEIKGNARLTINTK